MERAHINYVIKKLSYAARILSIIRHYFNKQTLIKLYYSFAYLYLKYGIISWGSACQTSLEKIQVLRNNIIRIMNFKFVKDKAKMCTMFKSMKILKVKDIFELEIAKFIALIITPCYLKISTIILNMLANFMITKRDQLLQTIFIWNKLKLETGNDRARTLK